MCCLLKVLDITLIRYKTDREITQNFYKKTGSSLCAIKFSQINWFVVGFVSPLEETQRNTMYLLLLAAAFVLSGKPLQDAIEKCKDFNQYL